VRDMHPWYTQGVRDMHPMVYPWWERYTLWYTRSGRGTPGGIYYPVPWWVYTSPVYAGYTPLGTPCYPCGRPLCTPGTLGRAVPDDEALGSTLGLITKKRPLCASKLLIPVNIPGSPLRKVTPLLPDK